MQETTLLKIKNLVKNADKFENMQFRLLLEELIKQGGRDAETLVGSFAISEEFDSLTRINIIRSMGYITSSTFLVPLRKILESPENLNLRKAAIISISKYNDNRALNMLSMALKRIENPILQDSISAEISRIKQDNPILGLLPKFLGGVNDPKTFRNTLEVLKKVLNPQDAHTFIYHLNSETPFVGDGAFEILCWRGDDSVQFSIFDYFRKKLKGITCIEADECLSLLHLISQVEKFIVRNPETINYVLKELKELYRAVKDPQIKDVLVNIFSRSHKREVLAIIEEVYNKEESRREQVIEKLQGNEEGAYILLYKYKKDDPLKEQLMKALLTTRTGADYITEIFDTLSPGYRKLVIDNINIDNYRFFNALIERFLLSDDYGQKRFALEKMKESRDFHFHTILFDPQYEKEFLRMHQDFLSVTSELFPLKTFRFVFNRVIELDAARAMMRKYFDPGINPFITAEAIIAEQSAEDLENFVDKLVKFNNKELSLGFLTAFYYIKTMDFQVLNTWQNMIGTFKTQRGIRLSPEEKGLLNKVSANFLNINGDIKRIQQGDTNINHFQEKEFPDYDILEYVMKNHPLTFFVRRQQIFDRIKKTFKMVNELDAFDSIKFLLRHPRISLFFKEEIGHSSQSSNYLLKQDADKLMEIMPESLRVLLIFAEHHIYAFFKDQLHELMPEAEVVEGTEEINIQPEDILITDSESMEKLTTENRINTKRLFVLIKDTSEFHAIKDFKPRVFPSPFSLNKVLKALLPDFFSEETQDSVEKEE
jgi:hypothetical protein